MSEENRELGPHPTPGDTIGRYRLQDTVGSGGMASVFRALGPDGTVVAVKVLNPARVLPEEVKRFRREYKALSSMDHPNIVRVHEAGLEGGYPWIAMEYVEGSELGRLIDAWKENPPSDRYQQIERILRGLCEGLAYVHDMGLIHRDIKPSNVLLTKEGKPKLSDFGVVKDPNATGTQLTMAGRLVGTVAFMAPELISAEPVDCRADLYALGAILYILLTFRRPIEARSVAGYLARHLTEVPTAPSLIDPSVPKRLERICQRLLLKDPNHRYASAGAVAQALDRDEEEGRKPIRGRQSELARFSERLTTLRDGAGGCMAVHGPRGVGKTLLLRSFVEHAQSQGVTAVLAQPGPGGLLDELAKSIGVEDESSGEELLSHLVRFAHDEPRVLAVARLDEAQKAEVDLLARLVRDQVTLEGQPLLLLFTARDLEGALSLLVTGASTGMPTEALLVRPLALKGLTELLRDHGLTGSLAPILGRRLHQEFGGMPGPVLEQLRELVNAKWLAEIAPDTLRPLRPLEDFRRGELPVPAGLQAQIKASMQQLPVEDTQIVELLAVLGRPATPALLDRAIGGLGTATRIDGLVRAGTLRRSDLDEQEVVELAHPAAARVIRQGLPDEVRRGRHASVAKALSSRRRTASVEVASHLLAAGDPQAAYPMFIRGARRAARSGQYSDVLEICKQAEQIRARCEKGLDTAEATRLRRWLFTLKGEALLARRHWEEAIEPLERAVAAARIERDGSALTRCLSSLGRAHYRMARFVAAEPLLREALEHSDPGAPERAAATRALADIQLREGQLDASELRWQEALEIAIEVGSSDGEARARRGLAHLRGLQGRLIESAEQLDAAEELLNPAGDDRVRAGVLARSIELDHAAGRYGNAQHKADVLIQLARRREMPERLPEAYMLHAEVCQALGDREQCEEQVRQALLFAQGYGSAAWASRLRIARVLCVMGKLDEAEGALPDEEAVPQDKIDDPPAQAAAIRARILSVNSRATALDLASWALGRPPPLLNIRAARIYADVAHALTTCGQVEAARNAAKRGLKVFRGAGADGLRLDLLLALDHAAPDERVVDAASQVARRIMQGLSPTAAASFSKRPAVAAVLSRTR